MYCRVYSSISVYQSIAVQVQGVQEGVYVFVLATWHQKYGREKSV
jgi:hypothetical protein